MMGLRLAALAFLALALSYSAAAAAGPEAAPQPDFSWVDRLDRQTGVIELPSANARLNVGEDYYFLGPDDARKVLVDGWGNPPQQADGVLGLVFPADVGPLDETGWGAVVTYQDDGYVSDKDAHKIDYDKMLKEMQSGEDENNEARHQAGYQAVHLVGWAERPAYDAERHLLIWARELEFEGSPHNTLNYDIRVLGRRGVLSLNIVSGMDYLPDVRAGAGDFAKTAAFTQGARYADFRKGQDKVAAYGIAGLVGAGALGLAAKKAGLLAIVLVFLKKGAVFLVAGVVAGWRWLKRLFVKDS